MKNNSIIKAFLFIITLSLFSFSSFSYADDSTPSATFIISDGSTLLFNGSVALPATSDVSMPDSDGNQHTINAHSALAMIHQIDEANDSFSISNLKYYDSFGAFYLKCITPKNASEDCDNWEYTVNGVGPSSGLDSIILSGGETVELYFGSPYQASTASQATSSGPIGSGPLVYSSPATVPISFQDVTTEILPTPTPTPSPVIVPPAVTVVPDVVKPEPVLVPIVKPKLSKSGSIATTVKNNSIAKVSTPKNSKPKIENIATENTATVINAVTDIPSTTKTKPQSTNWFVRFLDSIFGF